MFQTLILLPFLLEIGLGKLVEYDWTVEYFNGSPDGVTKQILGVNHQFPGPTIRATKGDILIVRVKNRIQTREPTTIHWHGIEQFGFVFEDGGDGVTQCSIRYGDTMTYKFRVEQSGTYWWHSHHSNQYTDGCWGAIVIEDKVEIYENDYDGEILFMLSEWFHPSARTLADWYLSPASQGNEPIPDSVLINGRGSYPCSYAKFARRQCMDVVRKFYEAKVSRGFTYRVRIINTSSMANFKFSIDNHMLETIEVDGVATVRVNAVDFVQIYPGQRYSFLVKMNATSPGNIFWVRAAANLLSYNATWNINPFPEAFFNNSEAKAILKYSRLSRCKIEPNHKSFDTDYVPGRPENHVQDWGNATAISEKFEASYKKFQSELKISRQLEKTLTPATLLDLKFCSRFVILTRKKKMRFPTTISKDEANSTILNPNECRPFGGNTIAPLDYDQLVTLNVTFALDDIGTVRSGFNHISYGVSPIPVIIHVMRNSSVPEYVHPIYTPLGGVVQIVVNNPNPGGHPFHLHGHTFWVVGAGQTRSGNYSEPEDGASLILNGVRRDTTIVHPYSWMVIRYIADNPGVWLFHCHYNFHLLSGLGAVVIEGAKELQILANRMITDESRRICGSKWIN